MKIALVNTRISSRFSEIECTYDQLPPVTALPLLACETERRLHINNSSVEIRAFDRPLITEEFVEALANYDIVGFTIWFSNAGSAIDLAEQIKNKNSHIKIVFGGPDATNLNRRLLVNRNCIDYVVAGDGEDSIWRLALNYSPDSIPNLWYRSDMGIQFSYTWESSLDDIEPFDFRHVSNLDLQLYDSRRSDYVYNPQLLPISVVWTRGCPRAEGKHRCAYCSIPGAKVRSASAENAWAQVEHLRQTHGITAFFEGGDDFASSSFSEELLNSSSRVSNINVRSYAGLWQLTNNKIDTLKKLGLSEVFLGLETTDIEINKWSGHSVTRKLVFETLARLQDCGISVCIPFIFGLPRESFDSLRSSESLAYDLVDSFDNIRMVLVSLAIPLIGSRWFDQLAKISAIQINYGDENLMTTDQPNYAKLLECSIENYCSVNTSDVVETVHRIRDQLSQTVKVGWFGDLDHSVHNSVNFSVIAK